MKLTTITNVSVNGVMQGLGAEAALDLVNLRSTPRGVSIQAYRPNGRPQYAPATAD